MSARSVEFGHRARRYGIVKPVLYDARCKILSAIRKNMDRDKVAVETLRQAQRRNLFDGGGQAEKPLRSLLFQEPHKLRCARCERNLPRSGVSHGHVQSEQNGVEL